ncbi:MAG: hypothetical protein ABI461_18290 [Polyangiaceae bacterium]
MKRGALFALALASCHGGCSGNSADNTANEAPVDAGLHAADASALAAARCTKIDAHVGIGSPIDVGEAVITSDSFAIGLLREKNIFSVALAPLDLSKVDFVDIGTARAETAPPIPFAWDKSVYVTWIDSGALRIGRIENGKVAMIVDETIDPIAYFAKSAPTSEIPAFDVIVSGDHGVVVWDYADPTGGKIRKLAFSKSGVEKVDAGGAAFSLSPASSDADSPRLAPRKSGGFWAIWVARKLESTADAGAIEGPGESPAFRWLEAAPLDERGNRVGEVSRLTPTTGHVSGFDVLATADGAEVVVRDATESADNGTTISRIVLADKPGSLQLVSGEVGRSVPDVFGAKSSAGSFTWVVVPDANDATRIVPLGAPSGASPAPSVEPLLKSSRGLALRGVDAGGQLLVLRTAPNGPASPGTAPQIAEIALVRCGL